MVCTAGADPSGPLLRPKTNRKWLAEGFASDTGHSLSMSRSYTSAANCDIFAPLVASGPTEARAYVELHEQMQLPAVTVVIAKTPRWADE